MFPRRNNRNSTSPLREKIFPRNSCNSTYLLCETFFPRKNNRNSTSPCRNNRNSTSPLREKIFPRNSCNLTSPFARRYFLAKTTATRPPLQKQPQLDLPPSRDILSSQQLQLALPSQPSLKRYRVPKSYAAAVSGVINP